MFSVENYWLIIWEIQRLLTSSQFGVARLVVLSSLAQERYLFRLWACSSMKKIKDIYHVITPIRWDILTTTEKRKPRDYSRGPSELEQQQPLPQPQPLLPPVPFGNLLEAEGSDISVIFFLLVRVLFRVRVSPCQISWYWRFVTFSSFSATTRRHGGFGLSTVTPMRMMTTTTTSTTSLA